MYLAGIMTILAFPLWGSLSPTVSIVLGMSLLIPGGVDGTTQMFGSRESTNRLRTATGILLGIGVVVFVYGVVAGLLR